jgi:hypothetical protein
MGGKIGKAKSDWQWADNAFLCDSKISEDDALLLHPQGHCGLVTS